MPKSFSRRLHLTSIILHEKQTIACAISNDLFLAHPDWVRAYGEKGRDHCITANCFHLAFLAGAIEVGSPEMFGDYLRWTARMLGARGIAARDLEENLKLLCKRLPGVLLPEDRHEILNFVAKAEEAYRAPRSSSRFNDNGPLALERRVYLAAIISGQKEAALKIIDEVIKSAHDFVDIYVEIFAQAQSQIGDLWELNQITVAQEHAATAITEDAIDVLYRRQISSWRRRGSMVVAVNSGEIHQLGANLVTKVMEANGWDVQFLSTDVSSARVVAAVERSSATVLCISTTLVANLPEAVKLVRAVREKVKTNSPKIILGGAAYQMASSQFALEIGATAITDLRGALGMLCAPELSYSAEAAR
jgi:methanogenic corrinoid protein MtbC1